MNDTEWMVLPKWRPIKTAPKEWSEDGDPPPTILVGMAFPDGSCWIATAEWWDDHFAFSDIGAEDGKLHVSLCFEPTHWMPLPLAPPVTKSKKERLR